MDNVIFKGYVYRSKTRRLDKNKKPIEEYNVKYGSANKSVNPYVYDGFGRCCAAQCYEEKLGTSLVPEYANSPKFIQPPGSYDRSYVDAYRKTVKEYESDDRNITGYYEEVREIFKANIVEDVFDRNGGAPYNIQEPKDGWVLVFTEAEKRKLRPIAETLAMLDGNAFFGVELGDGRDWYEQYLSEAHALYHENGMDGWILGNTSFT